MKSVLFFMFAIGLSACTGVKAITSNHDTEQTKTQPTSESTPEVSFSSLPDLGEAPELTNEVWLNTQEPLRLANLRGQVVLLDMWTFG